MEPLTENMKTRFIAAVGFFLIGCLTWFFSTRRKLFMRLFVPREELWKTARTIPRDRSYTQGMRSIALLQMGIGIILGFVLLVTHLGW